MHVVIAGGSGFIGSALASTLRAKGHSVTILSRKAGAGRITWDDELPLCDALVNLCGEGILNRRWSDTFKQQILESRAGSTRELVEKMRKAPVKPAFFLNASAVGYYPDDTKGPCTEEIGPGNHFLGKLCAEWEGAAKQSSVPWAIVRIAVVLGKGGGTFPMLKRMFKWGLGGKVGSGQQGFPWIHLTDLIALFLFILEEKRRGVFNGASPDPVTNSEFTKALGGRLKRPTICTVPAWILRLALGEGADAVLKGASVYPEKALSEGFLFRYPTLEKALGDLANG